MTVMLVLNDAGSIGTSAPRPVACTSREVQRESINASLDLRNKKLMHIIQIELGIPTQTIRHRVTRSARDTQATLPGCCLVQKSLTGKSGDKLVLWTGISDFRISRSHTRQVAKALTQTGRAAANHTFNPQEIKPADFFGMADGMVSPHLVPGTPALTQLAAIVWLAPSTEQQSDTKVAISLSLTDSVVVPAARLHDVLHAYASHVHPDIPILNLSIDIDEEMHRLPVTS